MIFLIGLLTVVLVLDCVLLILLVLIQLPKKEAGAGVAFGGAATDALFGSGTGNVLTKATKWATITFFALLLVIGILQNRVYNKDSKRFKQAVEEQSKGGGLTPPVAAPATAPAAAPVVSNVLTTILPAATNTPAAPK